MDTPLPLPVYSIKPEVTADDLEVEEGQKELLGTVLNLCTRETGHGTTHCTTLGSTHGTTHGTDHGSTQGTTHGTNHGSTHGTTHGTNHGSTHGTTHGTDHGSTQGTTHGTDHGSTHGTTHGTDHGSTHGTTHGTDHGSTQGTTHGTTHGTDHGSTHDVEGASPPLTLLQQHLVRPVQSAQTSPPAEDMTVPLVAQVLTAGVRPNRPTRPFKAYPRDPLALSASVSRSSSLFPQDSNEAYEQFRREMLQHVRGDSLRMRTSRRPVSPQQPTSSTPQGQHGRDAAYWERRRRNNEAAKRSRDARRAKEDEIAIRAAFLEQENLRLRLETAKLRSRLDQLNYLLYTH